MVPLIWLFTVFYRAWHRDVPSSFRTCSAIILGFKPITYIDFIFFCFHELVIIAAELWFELLNSPLTKIFTAWLR